VHLDDTIVAVATPPGRGGIGVVRIAGSEAKAIAAPMLRLKTALEAGRARFAELVEPYRPDAPSGAGPLAREQARIDEVVVTWFAAPHSYTTDDIIEISAHGAPVVLQTIVELALAGGARLAEPGEFTMRAFLNGRIDLAQAEAVRDLIESQTLYQARIAARQLGGSLSKTLQPIKAALIELIAQLEAGIDFAEDDVSVLPGERILNMVSEVATPLEALAESFAYGRIVHEGLTLAIVGRPNVGKSSLFNRLAERERAIVTAAPGTTRDLVTETVSIGGIPVRLVDTAGIRRALDEAESIGIQKSQQAMADAGLALVVIDSSQPVSAEDRELVAQVDHRSAIVVLNKSDLGGQECEQQGVRTSAITGEGIAELRDEILKKIGGGQTESAMLTNVRQQKLVQDALAGLEAGRKAVESSTPHEMVLLDLYAALHALDGITGATTNDDILNVIFGKFCIGK
jgi:tRNA modification GTPase